QQRHGLINAVELGGIDLFTDRPCALGQLGHYNPSTVRPIARAEPAIVLTAPSRSAAVRSGVLVLAISSSCSRVTLPTLSVLGRALPEETPAAFLSRKDAGGVFITKVKLRSL